jgi:hypothetical protein
VIGPTRAHDQLALRRIDAVAQRYSPDAGVATGAQRGRVPDRGVDLVQQAAPGPIGLLSIERAPHGLSVPGEHHHAVLTADRWKARRAASGVILVHQHVVARPVSRALEPAGDLIVAGAFNAVC